MREVSAADVTPEEIATWRAIAIAPREVGGIPELHPLLDALEAFRAEVSTLRRQLEERRDVALEPPPGFEISEYAAIHHPGMLHGLPKICKRGPGAWAAFCDDTSCIGKDGAFHREPRPSSRTPEFIELTRFATPHDAANALRTSAQAHSAGSEA